MAGTNSTPYGYKAQWGYYTDSETGLLLLTHRYLDPTTGRFLTRDPAGCEASMNLYAYVGNGVVIKRDPSGFYNKEKCFEAIRKAREMANRIEEHLRDISNNLPPVAMLCVSEQFCAALPKRGADDDLLERWEKYREHVKKVEQLRRNLEEVLRQIDNNCNNHWKDYFGAEIRYFQNVLHAPIPEWPTGVFPCIPLPDMGVPRVPRPVPFPIRPPILVPTLR